MLHTSSKFAIAITFIMVHSVFSICPLLGWCFVDVGERKTLILVTHGHDITGIRSFLLRFNYSSYLRFALNFGVQLMRYALSTPQQSRAVSPSPQLANCRGHPYDSTG